MENYKELLRLLYKEHAPEKLDQIDFYLDKYKGKEKQFFITQKAKYANKKSVKDSKKILEEAMARINKDQQKPVEEKKAVPKKKAGAKPKKEVLKKEDPKNKALKASKRVKPEEKEIVHSPKIETKTKLDESKTGIKAASKKKEIEESSQKKAETKIVPSLGNQEIMPSDAASIETKSWEERKKGFNRDPYKTHEDSTIPHDEKRKPAYYWILYLIVFFVIIAALVYLIGYPLSIFESSSKEVEKPKVENILHSESDKEEIEPVNEEVPKEKDPNFDQSDQSTESKNISQFTVDRIYARDLKTKVIFVACFAEKTEILAQKQVEKLKSLELQGHYYWIPDIDPNGNAYFKIVVGPFNTRNEAYPSLTKVQERINFDAYLLEVEQK